MIFLVLTVLWGAIQAVTSSVLRGDTVSPKFNTDELLISNAIATQKIFGEFPENPTYITHSWFKDASCSTLVFVHNIVVDTCLKTGTTSRMYHCRKKLSFRISFQFHNFFFSIFQLIQMKVLYTPLPTLLVVFNPVMSTWVRRNVLQIPLLDFISKWTPADEETDRNS
jgi:hypothetical protein